MGLPGVETSSRDDAASLAACSVPCNGAMVKIQELKATEEIICFLAAYIERRSRDSQGRDD